MTFLVIALALLLQRIFQIDNQIAKYDLFMMYYRWLHARFSQSTAWSGLSGVLVAVLPGLIIFTLLMTFILHIFGWFVYYLISLFVVWYYMDAKPLAKELIGEVKADDVLAMSYQRIFAIIFWFAIFGASGVVLYTLVASLRIELESQESLSASEQSMLKSTIECEAVLDWVPLRLLGLSYALVGEFSATFQAWSKALGAGVGRTREYATEWALISLGYDKSEDFIVNEGLRKAIESLINRALVLWLVALALFAFGHWVG